MPPKKKRKRVARRAEQRRRARQQGRTTPQVNERASVGDSFHNLSDFDVPMLRRPQDGEWVCGYCDAVGRVGVNGEWIGAQHSTGCPVGLGDDFGSAYSSLREVEFVVADIRENLEEAWESLPSTDTDTQDHLKEDTRLQGLLRPQLGLLAESRAAINSIQWPGTKERDGNGDPDSFANVSERNTFREMLRDAYQSLDLLALEFEEAWKRLDDGQRRTKAEHAAVSKQIAQVVERCKAVLDVLIGYGFLWLPPSCSACNIPCSPEGYCDNCDHTDPKTESEWRRTLEEREATRTPCSQCGASSVSSSGSCLDCGEIDEGVRKRVLQHKEEIRVQLRTSK